MSWYQGEPVLSLRLIRDLATLKDRIIDIGGGTSSLAARLSQRGFRGVTVVDIADAALRSRQHRSNAGVPGVRRIDADVTTIDRLGRFDVWHDRAVFHFLTDPQDRRAYVDLAQRTVPLGGHLVLATFALDGPEKCSGLDVVRYDGRKLEAEFAPGFALVRELRESHRTPWGVRQPFTYVVLRRVPVGRARPSGRRELGPDRTRGVGSHPASRRSALSIISASPATASRGPLRA